MKYEPLEFAVPSGQEWVLDLPGIELPTRGEVRRNPRRRLKQVPAAFAFPSDTFKGLRVQIALLRDPSWTPGLAAPISSGGDVAKLFDFAQHSVQESFYVLLMTATHDVIGVYEVARGTITQVSIIPADVLRPVLVSGAAAFIIVHNHPSGTHTPSAVDIELTKRIASAATVLGLVLLDHIVIGLNGFTSLMLSRPEVFD